MLAYSSYSEPRTEHDQIWKRERKTASKPQNGLPGRNKVGPTPLVSFWSARNRFHFISLSRRPPAHRTAPAIRHLRSCKEYMTKYSVFMATFYDATNLCSRGFGTSRQAFSKRANIFESTCPAERIRLLCRRQRSKSSPTLHLHYTYPGNTWW